LLSHIVQSEDPEALESLQIMLNIGAQLPIPFVMHWNNPLTQLERDVMRILIQHDVKWLPVIICDTIICDCPDLIDDAFQRGLLAKELTKYQFYSISQMMNFGYSAAYRSKNVNATRCIMTGMIARRCMSCFSTFLWSNVFHGLTLLSSRE
jgi:hypothetical protein